MAEVWSTLLELTDLSAKRAELGPPNIPSRLDQVGESVGSQLGTLRVGFPQSQYPTPRVRCDIWLPDNGTAIERVDVPLVGVVPLPVTLYVRALTEPPAPGFHVTVQVSRRTDGASRYGMTQSEFAPGEGAVGPFPLEPWCQAVTIHDLGVTGEWFDAAAVSMGAFEGKDTVRPRGAVAFTMDSASTWTQHYST